MFISSPFKGWVRPLKDTPDPAFANELLGGGVAIDPLSSELYAPCDGVIVNIAPSLHSVIIKTSSDIEILIHIGIDTVQQKGEGFKAHKKAGDSVKTGDKLISFDLDLIATNAPSLITPIIVLTPNCELIVGNFGILVEAGDTLFEILPPKESTTNKPGAGIDISQAISQKASVGLKSGLHARPAGEIVRMSKQFLSETYFSTNGKTARTNSVVALMSLNIGYGDEIEINARGNDAQIAISSLIEFLKGGHFEEDEPHTLTDSVTNNIDAAGTNKIKGNLYGVMASPGFACAIGHRLANKTFNFKEEGAGLEREKTALNQAIKAVGSRLEVATRSKNSAAAAISEAHIEMLQDPELIRIANESMANGKSAPFSWRHASRTQEDILKRSNLPRIKERAADLRDLEEQILFELCGASNSQNDELPDECIIFAEDLLPSQFLVLNHKSIKAICTKFGGPTSHVGILASSFGIPMLVAIGKDFDEIENGKFLILDADEGHLNPNPTPNQIRAAQKEIKARQMIANEETKAAQANCVMADGTRIEVFANLASVEEANLAVKMGAEGCGLLRTEFLFMERDCEPSEDEQSATMREIARALGKRPLIVRTLDIGGDKPISYLPFPKEENPALGMRGIRFQLENIDLFKTQVRAILRAGPASQIRIMLPMIIDVAEYRAAKTLIEETAKEIKHKSQVSIGIMIETPSAALMADSLAKEADFLSIGSNDLTQYTLAMDRGNPELAARADSLHPAVLNLIALAAKAAKKHKKYIGVCGGIAANPKAAAILLGLGVNELSVPINAVRQVKSAIRLLSIKECEKIAKAALGKATAAEVRQLLDGGKK